MAKDVCDTLGIANSSDAISGLKGSEKDGVDIADPIGRKQNTVIISESGFYKILLRSRKPAAEPFVEWITGEVIPSIRKTGSYAKPEQTRQPGEMFGMDKWFIENGFPQFAGPQR